MEIDNGLAEVFSGTLVIKCPYRKCGEILKADFFLVPVETHDEVKVTCKKCKKIFFYEYEVLSVNSVDVKIRT